MPGGSNRPCPKRNNLDKTAKIQADSVLQCVCLEGSYLQAFLSILVLCPGKGTLHGEYTPVLTQTLY